MKKVIKYIFLITIISNYCFSQSNNYFEKVSLKLNNSKNLISGLGSGGTKVYSENFKLLNLSKSKNTFFKKNNYYNRRSDSLSILKKKLNPKYSIWLPISEVIGLNLGLGAFNAYVTDQAYAKISFKTIKKNFQTGFVWDHDHFVTNFFAHPYHGNLYYNFARSSGYNFWESSPFALGGSLMWELFMENEPPSTNDLINTTVSGIFLGEVLYRLSSLIINERKRGFPRIVSEVTAGLLNPARGFNRLIHGTCWRVTNVNAYESEPLTINASYGINRVLEGTKFFTGVANGVIDFNMIYGNPFEVKKRNPFDFFRIRGVMNFGAGQPFIGTLTAYAVLAGKNYQIKKQSILAGIFQHYDYFDNNIYKVGGISFGAGLISYFPSKSKDKATYTSFHLNVMPFGAANSEYSAFGEKEYNFSVGMNMKFETGFDFGWGQGLVNYNLYWMHTVVGAESDEYIGLLKPKLQVKVYKNISVGTEYVFYHREGFYKDYPDIHLKNNETKIFVNYDFRNIRELLRK